MTADDKRTSMVERVRAMFAKAASSEFPEEAEAFEAKAMRLMAEYEIQERELREAGPYGENVLDLTDFGNAGQGAAALAIWVYEMFGGYGVLWSVGDGQSGRCKIYATPAQCEQASLVLDHMLPQLRRDLTRDRPRSRKSYALGWAQEVVMRLKDAQAVAYSQSNALVPTNSEAQRAYEEENGRARAARTQTRYDDTMAGRSRGAEADLNHQRKVTA